MILPLICFVLTWITFGFYYGWMDDSIIDNYLRGEFSARPVPDFYLYLRGFSQIIAWLYARFPSVPWFGLLLFVSILGAVFNLFYFINRMLTRAKVAPWKITLLLLLIFGGILLENVFLLNITRSGLLLAGASLFCLADLAIYDREIPRKSLKFFLFTLLFVCGYLIRPETTVIPLAFFSLLLLFFISPKNKKQVISVLVVIMSVILLHQTGEFLFKSEEKVKFEQKWPAIWNTLDGSNYQPGFPATREDSIRLRALQMWYFQDSTQFDQAFFERAGAVSSFSGRVLGNWRHNLYDEYEKSRYTFREYHTSLNWFWKNLIMLSLSVILTGGFLYQGSGNRRQLFIRFGLLSGLFLGTILIPAIFIKMEDRILAPSLIFFILSLSWVGLQAHSNEAKPFGFPKAVQWVALLALTVLASWRLVDLHQLADEYKQENETKRLAIQELKKAFPGKILLYDILTMSALHGKPLACHQPIAPQNKNLAFGEYWSQIMHSFLESQKQICPQNDWPEFFSCLYENRENVVFVHSKYRIDLLEEYFEVLYGVPYKFQKILPDSRLSQIRYSFFQEPMDFDYYQFREMAPLSP
ncbi:MAG: hypothetical protein H6581_09755 [Bacteroidia bacterium]|nr:hypothetical protein [Bacteroidia bacterium]